MRWVRAQLAATSRGDRVLAIGLAALSQLEVWVLGGGTAPRALASVAGLLMTLPLVVRRRHPLVAVGAAMVAFAAVFATTDLSSDDDAYVPFIVMLVAAYTAGAYTRGAGVVAGALCTLAFPVVITVSDRDGFSIDGLIFFGMIALPPYLAGVAIARRRARERALERHAATLDAERERAAAAAAAHERVRIARELHDVVAHGVSTIVVQAQGGARMVRVQPDEAEQALAAIERTGRQALAEMRRLLGMLRATDERADLSPQPGIGSLGDLVDGIRRAGLPVELEVEGRASALPPGVDVSSYRVVQEALTNALKHAGPAHARVSVRYLPGAIELDVTDDGTANGNGATDGHGLIGMRERVAVYGGQLEAGARPTGGFRVRARLPFESPSP